jgi:hypothetical protein
VAVVWPLLSVMVSVVVSFGRRVRRGAAVAGLVQHISWFDPIGRYGDRLAAQKELQRFLPPRENLVGAAIRGLQSSACSVLAEEEMPAVTEVLVHECG